MSSGSTIQKKSVNTFASNWCDWQLQWQTYLDSHLREVVGVTQGGSDVEAELFAVLNGGVSKPDAHRSSLHRKQRVTMLFAACRSNPQHDVFLNRNAVLQLRCDVQASS